MYEYTVTGRRNVGDQGQDGETNVQEDGTSLDPLYPVNIDDDPNLVDVIHRLTLIPIK
jgi:hypothetical protein